MVHRTIGLWLCFVLGAGTSDVWGAEDRDQRRIDRAVGRAMALLPRHPLHVAVIDAYDAKPDVRDRLLTLDAFVVNGGKAVYLVRQSVVLREAAKGSGFHDRVLAAIIWHEMAHLEGADEPGARRAEEQLWRGFIRDGELDPVTALRYLRALAARPDDRLRAAR